MNSHKTVPSNKILKSLQYQQQLQKYRKEITTMKIRVNNTQNITKYNIYKIQGDQFEHYKILQQDQIKIQRIIQFKIQQNKIII
ncbi:unnamed protein product [Paramecium sonneborni]|uniref:Uncharacterized protein n=1 Tax=Paramecium sonneborni TaxID=65129 RepID=A0A8S1QKL3_9CILI|nr:unnamed protein product [Paramecium sonneborni]